MYGGRWAERRWRCGRRRAVQGCAGWLCRLRAVQAAVQAVQRAAQADVQRWACRWRSCCVSRSQWGPCRGAADASWPRRPEGPLQPLRAVQGGAGNSGGRGEGESGGRCLPGGGGACAVRVAGLAAGAGRACCWPGPAGPQRRAVCVYRGLYFGLWLPHSPCGAGRPVGAPGFAACSLAPGLALSTGWLGGVHDGDGPVRRAHGGAVHSPGEARGGEGRTWQVGSRAEGARPRRRCTPRPSVGGPPASPGGAGGGPPRT